MALNSRNQIDKKLLQGLETLKDLSLDKLDELAAKSTIDDLPAGRQLFRQGEKDKRLIFLLSGQLELTITGNPNAEIIKARTPEANYPIAESFPRNCTAKTKTKCSLLFVDKDLLEILQSDDSSGFIEVEELSTDDESAWMLRFLQSRAFLKLPTDTIQNLLVKMEEVPAQAGDVIISQGDVNEYYYIIQRGKCAVSRRPAPKAQDVQIAILHTGDGFGEEALITGGKRNATITMLEDGSLMRLNKKDFMSLLAKPLISYINKDTALEKVSSGNLIIDVRLYDQFNASHVEGSVNIPLSMLRLKVEGLNAEREYVLVCDDGNRSSAAAFLLTQHGLNCYVLEGGLKKNDIRLPGANLSVAVSKPPENKQSLAAEKTKKAAEAKAAKLKQEANSAKTEAKSLAKRAADAEAAKKKAEKDLQRLQKEEASKRDAALKAAKQRLDSESNRAKEAENRAAKLKLEAKAAKRRAEEELEKLRTETRANNERQATLDQALNQAKTIAADAAKKAKLARQEAEAEAKKIRKQAEAEAAKLRKDMEDTVKRMEKEAQRVQAQQAQQTQQHEAALKKVQQKAMTEAEQIRSSAQEEAEKLRAQVQAASSKATAKATQKAKQEAEQIRLEAQQEAEKLRAEIEATRTAAKRQAKKLATEEAEQIRLEALKEAESLRAEIAATRNAAKQEATKLAQQEAERIRQEALLEAEQLRTELESAKYQAQNIAAAVAAQEKEKQQLLHSAKRQAEEFARSKAREAKEEAERIRRQASDEASRLREEVSATRQILEKQKLEAQIREANARKQQLLEQKRRISEEKTRQQSSQQKAELMRQKAEAIKARLEKAEQVRQADEARHQAEGMSLSKATVRRVKNRIILEGAEDVFIFKEPTVQPEDVQDPDDDPVADVLEDELPSFVIETPADEDYVPVSRAQIDETYERHSAAETTFKKQRNRKVFAIAASIVMTTVLGISLFIFQPEDKIPQIAKNNAPAEKKYASTAKTKTIPAATLKKDKSKRESLLKRQAAKRFNSLLEQWEQEGRSNFKPASVITKPTSLGEPEATTVSEQGLTPAAGNNSELNVNEQDTLAFEEQEPAEVAGTASSVLENFDSLEAESLEADAGSNPVEE